jgi:hypothetical protein
MNGSRVNCVAQYTGKLVIEHSGSKAKITINFKQGSKFGGDSSRNKIEGKITDDGGSEAAELSGRWDESSTWCRAPGSLL